ncbi:lipopolysaccharide biosynthesis protein [Deinococcus alpinitundrae]|uniref:lipopolysaccharide biosynthesis protein n=1 Tax=Deinococcus alpinitundrae TaxID=468913 RepID=UPI00137A1B24|nr:oligosaccharide flippase family protein [Deinococcus alpinitundrae]
MNLMRKIENNRFAKNTLILVGGTASGQLILVAVSPLLTRLYSPADFGVLSVYISILGLTSIISSLRYDQAILLPKEEKVATDVLNLSLVAAIFSAIFSSVVIIAIKSVPLINLKLAPFAQFFWIIPFGILTSGFYQSLSSWAVRNQNFSSIATTRLYQGAISALIQVISGFLGLKPFGLILGQFMGQFMGTNNLWRSYTQSKPVDYKLEISNLRYSAHFYRRFPLLAMPASLLNSSSLLVPPILLAFLYGSHVAGWFALAQRVIGTPMTVIGGAVSQVYAGEAAVLISKNSYRELDVLFSRTIKRTLPIVFLIVILGFIAPYLFPFVFGEAWQRVGIYTSILSFAFASQILISPVSSTANLVGRQDLQLIADISRTFFTILGIYISYASKQNDIVAVSVISGILTFHYLIFYILNRYSIKSLERNTI